MRSKRSLLAALMLVLPLVSANSAFAGVTATSIYNLGYPVGLAEDSSGNIYIADDHNSVDAKKGIVVVPAATGTLFGQSVTAGTALTLVPVAGPAGIAISSSGTLIWTLTNGNIYALASSSRTVFGVSVTANTVTLIASGTDLKGGLDFDSAGNLYGVHIATGSFSVLPASTGTLFGQSVTANTSATLFSNGSYWFWDLAVDSAGNIFVADGWGSQGVFVLPVATATLYGQAVTANTLTRMSTFGVIRYAGIDVDSNDVLFANQYHNVTRALASSVRTVFGVSLAANTATSLNSTSGYIDQGLLVAANGDLISGGGANTFRLVATPDLSAPGAPTIGLAVATSPTSVSVSFVAPTSNGGAAIETYTATSTPGSLVGQIYQASSGSISVSGLTPSTDYTFTVTASNSVGTSSSSSASVSIKTPASGEELAARILSAIKAAQEAREAITKVARDKLIANINSKSSFAVSDLASADLYGATDLNISVINAEILQKANNGVVDLEFLAKVVNKYATIDKISGKVSKFTFHDLQTLGLISDTEIHRTSIVLALRNLDASDLDTFAELQIAVTSVHERCLIRRQAIREIRARIQARRAA